MIPAYNGKQLDQLLNAPPPTSHAPPSPLNLLPCPQITPNVGSLSLAIGQPQQITATTSVSGISPTFQFVSTNASVASVDMNTGVVTAKTNGTALIYVSAPPNVSCSAPVSVVVASETYTGTMSLHATDTFPNMPGWTPSPMTTTTVANAFPISISMGSSLLQAAPFTAIATLGPGNITVTIPTQTCAACNPPVTVPGATTTIPFPASSVSFTGSSDGKILSIPLGNGFIMTGTLSVIANTVQVTLNLDAQEPDDAGGTVSFQLSASLTRQ
jgi:hypothetical protein